LPGEKAKYTLAITKSGGGAVTIDGISFAVSFGSGQSGLYGKSPGKAVMIRKSDGSLVPSASPPPGITSTDQSRQLQYAAQADFSDANAAFTSLMTYYCAGRGSWDSGGDTVLDPACKGDATDCSKATNGMGAGAGTKWQYPHLWAALELVARKSALGATRIATLRQRLICGAADTNVVYGGFAMMMLGYLGDDPAAHTFLAGKAAGSGDLATIAKAALLLMGEAADKTQYEGAVKTGSTTGSTYVKAACAAALGIANLDDTTVTSALVPLAQWTEPDKSDPSQVRCNRRDPHRREHWHGRDHGNGWNHGDGRGHGNWREDWHRRKPWHGRQQWHRWQHWHGRGHWRDHGHWWKDGCERRDHRVAAWRNQGRYGREHRDAAWRIHGS
jgi:hypothetical protein